MIFQNFFMIFIIHFIFFLNFLNFLEFKNYLRSSSPAPAIGKVPPIFNLTTYPPPKSSLLNAMVASDFAKTDWKCPKRAIYSRLHWIVHFFGELDWPTSSTPNATKLSRFDLWIMGNKSPLSLLLNLSSNPLNWKIRITSISFPANSITPSNHYQNPWNFPDHVAMM